MTSSSGTPHGELAVRFFEYPHTKTELNRNGRQPRLTDGPTAGRKNGAGKANFPPVNTNTSAVGSGVVCLGAGRMRTGGKTSAAVGSRLRPTVGKPGDNKPGERERGSWVCWCGLGTRIPFSWFWGEMEQVLRHECRLWWVCVGVKE